jgi:2-keto-4-pentenoate hydratase/2-oxohepta-3-ene-1,7-dioic acid hydratase in catechol pathway
MQLVTYERNNQRSTGVLTDTGVVDLPSASRGAIPGDMLRLLQGGAGMLAQAWEALGADSPIPLADIQIKAPIAKPGKLLGIGLNYADHAAEGGRKKPDYPLIFAKTVPATIGMGEAIHLPPVSQMVDFEGELAVVIGTLARAVSARDALDYVAGYTICNDVSARDYQRRSGHTPGKSFETFAPLGPVIVTRDEVPDPHALDIRTVVSGQEMQHSNTKHLIFRIPDVIEYLSHIFPLEPGDVITTGTPSGVGAYREPPRFLKAGDTVRIEVEGIGVLENPVVAG